jgi:Ser/Thr protein kinase RdoA (MazF antagonist)
VGSFFVSWERRFDRPIILPNGKTLRTLEDARRYILTLPRSEHETTAWQIAIEAVLLAADHPAAVAAPERPAL